MAHKIVFVADGSMYEVDYNAGSISLYNAERMERDIELGYSVTVRPATKGERAYAERVNSYRRPIKVVDYDLELEGVL